MIEYHFMIYDNKKHVLWQFIGKAANDKEAETLAKTMCDRYNQMNDKEGEDHYAATCRVLKLTTWLNCLRYRGKDYMDKDHTSEEFKDGID